MRTSLRVSTFACMLILGCAKIAGYDGYSFDGRPGGSAGSRPTATGGSKSNAPTAKGGTATDGKAMGGTTGGSGRGGMSGGKAMAGSVGAGGTTGSAAAGGTANPNSGGGPGAGGAVTANVGGVSGSAGASGHGGVGGGNDCSPGLVLCGSVCVDTNTDNGNCGQCGTRCNSGFCAHGGCPSPCSVASTTHRYFCEDFENGLSQWQTGTWATTEAKARSTTHSLTDSPDANYPTSANSMVVMGASVDLTAATAPMLQFWHVLQLNACPLQYTCTSCAGDYAVAEVSTDGGFAWTELRRWVRENSATWSLVKVDLAAYVGSKIKLRFTLRDDGCTSNEGDGWYLDDLEIRESECGRQSGTAGSAGSSHGGEVSGAAGQGGNENGGPVGGTASASGGASNQGSAGTVAGGGISGTGNAGSRTDCAAGISTLCGTEASPGRYFCEDFECGLSQWEAGGSWTTTTSVVHGAAHSITESPEGNYPRGANSTFEVAASIDLTTASAPFLQFWHVLQLSACPLQYTCTGCAGDYATVEISTDCGFTWTELTRWTRVSYATWSLVQLDLRPFAGSSVRLRLTLRDDKCSASAGDTADGWYIDDMEVRELE